MKAAHDQFLENLARARSLSGLAQSLAVLVTSAVDFSDILRAALVSGVSALDHFVHELVRIGMLEVHRGKRSATNAYLAFPLPLAATTAAIADTKNDDWLDQAVRDAHGWLTFQHPDKIADAVRLMSGVKLWEAVGAELGMPARTVKTRLSAIVDRRNKIAHEADMDPTSPGTRWHIDQQQVDDALKFIEQVSSAVLKVA
jgi:hypothetical protein